MLGQYLSIILTTLLAATLLNAGCCVLPNGEGCADTPKDTCDHMAGPGGNLLAVPNARR